MLYMGVRSHQQPAANLHSGGSATGVAIQLRSLVTNPAGQRQCGAAQARSGAWRRQQHVLHVSSSAMKPGVPPLQLQEAGVEHARAAISLLGAAHELYARGPARPGRLLYHVGGLMVTCSPLQ